MQINKIGKKSFPIISKETYQSDLSRAFSWYNENIDDKIKKQLVLETCNLQTEQKKHLSKLDVSWFKTIGAVIDMVNNGNNIINSEFYIKDKLDYLLNHQLVEEYKPIIKKDDTTYIFNKMYEDISYEIDKIFIDKNHTFDVKNYIMINQIPVNISRMVGLEFKSLIEEIKNVYNGDDEILNESYAKLGKIHLRKLNEFFVNLDLVLSEFSVQKKRRIRKKKIIPISKQIFKLKYKKEFPELNLISVSPKELIGSTMVLLYNIKYKIIYYLQCNDSSKLEVQGTTINGWDQTISTGKRLRKPDLQIPNLISLAKKSLIKDFNKIKTKSLCVKGRMNEDVVILKIFK